MYPIQRFLTINNVIWCLAFLVDNDNDYQDDDFCKHTQERPKWCEVAAYSQYCDLGSVSNDVGCVAFVSSRIRV